MNLLESWKRNIQDVKWKTLRHNQYDYSNSAIDKRIKILQDFFHPSDLQLDSVSKLNLTTEASQIWIIYLLSQNNIGSFQLINLICDVIEYFSQKNIEYLKSKLLNNRGRINKNSFRNDFFEVWLNYKIFKLGIDIQLDKCFRNPMNPEMEGYDSYFNFNGANYIIECTKLKSWREEILELTYQMIETLYKRHKKFSSNPHFEPFVIYAIPNLEYNLGKKEFDKHLNFYFINKINKNEVLYTASSKAFHEIIIFTATQELTNKYEKIYDLKENVIKLNSEFKNVVLIDQYDKITNDNSKFASQKINFNVTAKCSTTKSPLDFEELLIKKIKKKIDQHRNLKGEKLIIAIELEKFNGLNSFPINTIQKFIKLKQKINENLSILVFYKDSQGNKLNINIQAMHKNDKFINFLNTSR